MVRSEVCAKNGDFVKFLEKNLTFFQNVLTFLFFRVTDSDSERFLLRSETFVSEDFRAHIILDWPEGQAGLRA